MIRRDFLKAGGALIVGFSLRDALVAQNQGAQERGSKPGPPDAKQVDFFFALLKEAIDNGAISEQFVADEVRRKHVRADTFELLVDRLQLFILKRLLI